MRRALVAVLFLGLMFGASATAAAGAGTDQGEPPPVTVNEFFPADRSLGDCLSALPKPGCGSEARGGMHQTAVFSVTVLGLGVIGTRIVVGIRRRDRENAPSDPAQR
ncbi:hypothetical protein BH23ACT3_BH23ACT3_16230 [soil metagenome]